MGSYDVREISMQLACSCSHLNEIFLEEIFMTSVIEQGRKTDVSSFEPTQSCAVRFLQWYIFYEALLENLEYRNNCSQNVVLGTAFCTLDSNMSFRL